MDSPQAVASQAVDYISSLRSKSVAGGELAQFLKFTFRGFSPLLYGFPNLRVFLQRNAPDVIIVGRAGGDVVYGLKAHHPDAAALKPSFQPPRQEVFNRDTELNFGREVWKTYSSPQSFWRLYGNPETGALQVIPPGSGDLPTPWVLIPPCTPEVHVEIANDFLSELPDERNATTLRQTLGQPRWWDVFHTTAMQLGLLREWQTYRRRRLKKHFLETLSKLKIPLKEEPIRRPIVPTFTPPQMAAHNVKSEKLSEVERIRRSVISAVERMSITELKALPIPVGYLLDEPRRD